MSALPVASQAPENAILHGDCLEVLRSLPDACVDAIVTDPPSGIAFMGKSWDNFSGKKRKDGQAQKALAESEGRWLEGRGTLPYGFGGDSPSPKARQNFIASMTAIFVECLRVLKPGGHALVWALPRTSHWTAMALEDAGFEVRDCVTHLFGSGFPKSLDVSKALDKRLGATRPVIGKTTKARSTSGKSALPTVGGSVVYQTWNETAPATDAAREWDGWGTALKPAAEFWWLCRKPLAEGTVAGNVLTWGTGALNIDGSRVGNDTSRGERYNGKAPKGNHGAIQWGQREEPWKTPVGRWPANLLLSHSLWCDETACALDCPIRALDAQSGVSSGKHRGPSARKRNNGIGLLTEDERFGASNAPDNYGDTGGASRYFTTFRYTAKASRSERNRGCEALPELRQGKHQASFDGGQLLTGAGNIRSNSAANHHPTVKPLALMSWLITLITPPGGLVLDPFAGSGSTLVAAKEGGWRYLGIEREAEYVAIAQARLEAAQSTVKPAPKKRSKKQPQPTLLEVSA